MKAKVTSQEGPWESRGYHDCEGSWGCGVELYGIAGGTAGHVSRGQGNVAGKEAKARGCVLQCVWWGRWGAQAMEATTGTPHLGPMGSRRRGRTHCILRATGRPAVSSLCLPLLWALF